MPQSSRKIPNHYSLGRSSHFFYLALGSAIGIGNLLILPSLMSKYGVTSVFLVHLVLLLFVSFPLVLCEMLWSRWLLRSIGESFKLVPRLGKFIWPLVIILWIDLTPSYIVEYSKVLLSLLRFHWQESPDVFLDRFHEPGIQEALFIYLLAAAIVIPSTFLAAIKKQRLVFFYQCVLSAIGLCLLYLFFYLCGRIDFSFAMSRLMLLDFSRIHSDQTFEIMTYTLFSVSGGIGIYFAYVFYGSQAQLASPVQDPFWQKSGVLLQIISRVFMIDLLFSFLAMFLLLPHLSASGHYGNFRPGTDSPEFFALFLFPKFLINGHLSGQIAVFAYTFLVLGVGLLSLISLVDVAYWSFDRELRMTRIKKISLLSFLLCLLLAAPLLPYVREVLSDFGSGFLLPVAALCWSLAAGWIMPRKVQAMLIGRGPRLDGFLVLWRFMVRWALPSILIYLLLMRTFKSLGM